VQESQQQAERGTAISQVDGMGFGALTVWQMTAHELLHCRFVNFMHRRATLANSKRKMFSDMHKSMEAGQNVPLRLKK
jgi:hypothetical protein